MEEMIRKLNPALDDSGDRITRALRATASYLVVGLFGLLPILFLSSGLVPFEYLKTWLVGVGVLVVLLLLSLSTIRSGRFFYSIPALVLFFLLAAFLTILSGLFSSDWRSSLIGDSVEVTTGLFVLLLALTATITTKLLSTKAAAGHFYALFSFSAASLILYQTARLIFGFELPLLNNFAASNTPIGSWNDLAVFGSLLVILFLLSIGQLKLPGWLRAIFALGILWTLGLLLVVNFYIIWLILAFFSLTVMTYGYLRPRLTYSLAPVSVSGRPNLVLVSAAALVFMVSVFSLVGSSALEKLTSRSVNISDTIEVRPSLTATLNVGRIIYSEHPWFGVGSNQFSTAWRLHKDVSVNQTIFWATDFKSGHSYLLTNLITGGLFSAIGWLLFLGALVIAGFRFLALSPPVDQFWYFVGSSAMVSSFYLWLTAFIYTPNPTILILASVFTGLFASAYSILRPIPERSLVAGRGRINLILFVSVSVLLVGLILGAIFLAARHFSALSAYNLATNAMLTGEVGEEIEANLRKAHSLYRAPTFARKLTEHQISRLSIALSTSQGTEEIDKTEIERLITQGNQAARLSTSEGSYDPRNWLTAAIFYAQLAQFGIEPAFEKSIEALSQTAKLDPQSPLIPFLEAQLRIFEGDRATARKKLEQALSLKTNYAPALYRLADLDVVEGRVDEARETIHSLIRLEPNNPTHFYRLGVLEYVVGNDEAAVLGFTSAIELVPDYANARYLLALSYIRLDRFDEALNQLSVVSDLNPDNETVATLIAQLEAEEPPLVTNDLVDSEIGPDLLDNGDTNPGLNDLDSPLITPVNQNLRHTGHDSPESESNQ